MRLRLKLEESEDKIKIRSRLNEDETKNSKILDTDFIIEKDENFNKEILKTFLNIEYGSFLKSGMDVFYTTNKKENDDLLNDVFLKYKESRSEHKKEINEITFGGFSPNVTKIDTKILNDLSKKIENESIIIDNYVIGESKRLFAIASYYKNGVLIKQDRKIKAGSAHVYSNKNITDFSTSLLKNMPKNTNIYLTKSIEDNNSKSNALFNQIKYSINATNEKEIELIAQTNLLNTGNYNQAKNKIKEINQKIEKEILNENNNVFFIDGGKRSTIAYSGYIQKNGRNVENEVYLSKGLKDYEEMAFLMALSKLLKTDSLKNKKTIMVCDGDSNALLKDYLDGNTNSKDKLSEIVEKKYFKEIKKEYLKQKAEGKIDLNIHYVKSHKTVSNFSTYGNKLTDDMLADAYSNVSKLFLSKTNDFSVEDCEKLTNKNFNISEIKRDLNNYGNNDKKLILKQKAKKTAPNSIRGTLYLTKKNDNIEAYYYLHQDNKILKSKFDANFIVDEKIRLHIKTKKTVLVMSKETENLLTHKNAGFLKKSNQAGSLLIEREYSNKAVLNKLNSVSNNIEKTSPMGIKGKILSNKLIKDIKIKTERKPEEESDLNLYISRIKGRYSNVLYSSKTNKIWRYNLDKDTKIDLELLRELNGQQLNIISSEVTLNDFSKLDKYSIEGLKQLKEFNFDIIETHKEVMGLIQNKKKLTETKEYEANRFKKEDLIIEDFKIEEQINEKEDLNSFVNDRFNSINIKLDVFYGNEMLAPNKKLNNDVDYVIMKFGNKTMNIHKFSNGEHIMERFPQDFEEMKHLESFLKENKLKNDNKLMISLPSRTALSNFGILIRENESNEYPLISSLLKTKDKKDLLFTKTSDFQYELIDANVDWYVDKCIDRPEPKAEKKKKPKV